MDNSTAAVDFSGEFSGGGDTGELHNDSHLCPPNTTFKLFGQDHLIPRAAGVYIALAVCHMVVVLVPAVLLSSLAIYFLVRRSLSKHPTNVVFCWICAVCIAGPCTYGILMDLSLILDRPLLARCENPWESLVLWLSYACAVGTYDALLTFAAITFYVSLHFNIRQFSQCRLNIALACVVAFAVLSACFWLILAESQAVSRCKIRGSFCIVAFGGKQPVSVTLEIVRIAIAILPLLISVVISLGLFYRKVRSSVLNFDRAMLLSFLRLFCVLAFGSFLWNLPTLLFHFASFDGTQRSFIEMLSTYTLQLNFVAFPLLTLSMHREVREAVLARLLCSRCRLGTSGEEPGLTPPTFSRGGTGNTQLNDMSIMKPNIQLSDITTMKQLNDITTMNPNPGSPTASDQL